MRRVIAASQVFFLLLAGYGCEPVPIELLPKGTGSFESSVYTYYVPVNIDIMPLTEFTYLGNTEQKLGICAYVGLLDLFGCQVKSPGIFRFELYEKAKRSAEPRGKRIAIWPDADLTDVVENNKHWRDFLRAYEFHLDFEPQSNQDYILQVTYLSPGGKRLSDEFDIRYTD